MAFRNKYMHFLQIFNLSSFRDAKELGEMKDPNVLKSQMYMFARTKKSRTARITGYSGIHIWTNETLLIKLSGHKLLGLLKRELVWISGSIYIIEKMSKMSTSLNFCMFMSFKTTILFFNPIFLLGVQAYITGGLPHIKATQKKCLWSRWG